jgi:predicted metal-dependent peptidase
MNNLTIEERIKRTIIELLDEQPFWAYLILKFRFTQNNDIETICVDARGNISYNKKWLEELTNSELKGVLMHETCHVVFGHCILRGMGRNALVWNYAIDIITNNIILMNKSDNYGSISLPESDFIPSNDAITVGNITIKELSKKISEIVYDLLNVPNSGLPRSGNGFDKHIIGEGMTEKERQQLEDKWKEAVIDAAVRAREKGKNPAGMERLIGSILDPKIDWKTVILRYITNTLPYDYSYSKPNRKALSQGIYLPGVVKENVEIVVSIDTSGSIDKKTIDEFATEVVGMCRAHNSIKMTVLVHDAEIQEVVDVNNENDFLSKVKMKGGGGTDHNCIISWILKNKQDCKLYISLTDGDSNIEECYPSLTCQKVIALTVKSKLAELEKYANVVVIDD